MRLQLICEDELSVLYHGTRKELLPEIMRVGLDPGLSEYADDEKSLDNIGRGGPYHFIFLAWSVPGAAAFAPGGDYHKDQDIRNRVILEVRLPPRLQEQLITDRGEFVRCPFVIEPKYLRVVG